MVCRLPVFPSPSTSRPALTNLGNSAEPFIAPKQASCKMKMNIKSWVACLLEVAVANVLLVPIPLVPSSAVLSVLANPIQWCSWHAVTDSDWLWSSASLLSSSSSLPVPPLLSSAAFFRRLLRRGVLFSACLTCRAGIRSPTVCMHAIFLYVNIALQRLSFTRRPSTGSPATPPKM